MDRYNKLFEEIKFHYDYDEDRTTISIMEGKIILISIYADDYFIDDFNEIEIEKLIIDNELLKIEHLEIKDEFKRQGFAKLLMNEGIKFAKKKNYKQIYLNASPMGFGGLYIVNLVEFYKKFGFRVIKDQGHNVQMIKNL